MYKCQEDPHRVPAHSQAASTVSREEKIQQQHRLPFPRVLLFGSRATKQHLSETRVPLANTNLSQLTVTNTSSRHSFRLSLVLVAPVSVTISLTCPQGIPTTRWKTQAEPALPPPPTPTPQPPTHGPPHPGRKDTRYVTQYSAIPQCVLLRWYRTQLCPLLFSCLSFVSCFEVSKISTSFHDYCCGSTLY